MQIVALLGSPRKGNSSAIARRFLAAGESLGATTRSFVLNTLTYRGCQACYACKTSLSRCVLQDDLADVLAAVEEADVVVLATPVYFGDITAQLKTFFDRTFSFFTPDYRTSSTPSRLAPDKKLVFIQTQGQPDESFFNDLFPRYERFFKRFGFAESHLIRACGLAGPDDVLKRENVLDEAERLVANLIASGNADW